MYIDVVPSSLYDPSVCRDSLLHDPLPFFPFYHSLLLLLITQVLSLPLTLGGTCLYLSLLFTVRLPFSVYSSLPFIA